MASRWTQAATILPPTLEVCGRRLLPFCLRHRVALEAIDSPILDLSKPFGATDVILAVRILSTHDLKDVNAPLSVREAWHMARMKYSVKHLKRNAVKLFTYFQAQSLWPRFWEKETKAKDNGIPWELVVVASLVRNGHTEENAWTMPEAQAIWLNIAHASSFGSSVQIVSDIEWEAMKKYKREQAEEQKKQTTRN